VNKSILFFVLSIFALSTATVLFKERTRTIEGTWLYVFEGSNFFEGQTPAKPCGLFTRKGAWLEHRPDLVYQNYDYRKAYPSSGSYSSPNGQWHMEAFSVKFKGRQKFALFGTGHFGMWSSSFEIDEMLSIKPISNIRCYVR
jgi:hypothetical protein